MPAHLAQRWAAGAGVVFLARQPVHIATGLVDKYHTFGVVAD